MQLTLGKRWAITLEITVRVAKARDACARHLWSSHLDQRHTEAAQLEWERNKVAGTMLSGWFDAPTNAEDYRSAGRRML